MDRQSGEHPLVMRSAVGVLCNICVCCGVCVCVYLCSLGQIQAGDRVREINGFQTDGLALQQASKLIRESGDAVTMEIEFDVAGMCNPVCLLHSVLMSVVCHMMSHDVMSHVVSSDSLRLCCAHIWYI